MYFLLPSHAYLCYYLIKGAGNEVVNGIYTMASGTINSSDAVTYVKHPATPEEPLLTLFRCTMRTKSKWYVVYLYPCECMCMSVSVSVLYITCIYHSIETLIRFPIHDYITGGSYHKQTKTSQVRTRTSIIINTNLPQMKNVNHHYVDGIV